MGIMKSKYDGTCGKCKSRFKAGEKIFVEKGKQPLCSKCSPPDAKELKSFPVKPCVTPWDHFAGMAMEALIQKPTTNPKPGPDIIRDASMYADAMMKERQKRGIK